MKQLLVGNGINIQFDNTSYTTQQIMLRILKNCDKDDFPAHVIIEPAFLLKNYYGLLYLEARKMIKGEYDIFAAGRAERDSLDSFKKQYSDRIDIIRITDIGPEDFYLIHDLLCHKTKTKNPEQFYVRESMKIAYFYAIYNEGKLNDLHNKYSGKFIDYLNNFDAIFTTNYDSNVDAVVNKEVYHIHGQFDKLAEVYNPDSFRNKLPDEPYKNCSFDPRYLYLYCNALSTHCGAYKQFQINQNSSANSAIEKMAVAYSSDADAKAQIDSWCKDKNELVSKMGYAVKLKASHPELHFSEDYHFEKLKKINGTLEILGLSPWNDFHIFESIDQSSVDTCTYYYFSEDQQTVICNLLHNLCSQDKLVFKSVKEFWSEML